MRYLAKCLYGKFWVFLRHFIASKKICYDGGVRILVYHSIPTNMLNRFRKHIIFIKQYWDFLDPNDWEFFLCGKKKFSGIRVLITFDDGFISQLYATKEILEPLGVRAIFFVPVNFIGLRNEVKQFVTANLGLKRFSEELLPMEWDDLRELVKNGHMVGSHTLNHPCLSKITDTDMLQNEIWESGNIIEEKLGTQVRWFAYPYGRNNSINFAAYNISKKRYAHSATDIGGLNKPNMDRHCVLRDSIRVEAPLDLIRLTLEGGLDFINHLRFCYLKKGLKGNQVLKMSMR